MFLFKEPTPLHALPVELWPQALTHILTRKSRNYLLTDFKQWRYTNWPHSTKLRKKCKQQCCKIRDINYMWNQIFLSSYEISAFINTSAKVSVCCLMKSTLLHFERCYFLSFWSSQGKYQMMIFSRQKVVSPALGIILSCQEQLAP